MNRRREKITIENYRRTIVYRRRQTLTIWCEQCAAPVEMVSPAEAAKRFGTSPRQIYRQIEAGDLHFTETGNDAPLVCGNSLSIKNEKQ